MFPVRNITIALQKVTYPIFASIQEDDVQLKHVFRKITSMVFFIITPVMLYLIVVAEPLFRFVLTEKWLPAVPFFQILCISAIVYPQSMYNLNIIAAKGRSDLHFKLEIIKKVSSVLFIGLIFPFGIWGVVYAQAISMLIHAFVNAFYSGKMINYHIKEQISDILPVITVGIFSMFTLYILDNYILKYNLFSDLLIILMSFIFYFAMYFGLSYLFKLEAIQEIQKILSNYKFRQKRSKAI